MTDKDQEQKPRDLALEDDMVQSAERVVSDEIGEDEYFRAVEEHAQRLADTEAKRARARYETRSRSASSTTSASR
ncbi:hypothetical protein [Streptosporangium longisporum]|uniref:hypothetical protein n=1 Tax=Streptosporangium longisporum TaxID=46187 RepID=UPI0031EBE57A